MQQGSSLFVSKKTMYLSKLFTSRAQRKSVLLLPLLIALSHPALAQNTKELASTASIPTPIGLKLASAPAAAVLARGPAGTVITDQDVLAELQRAPEATRKAVLAQPEAVAQLVNNLLVRRVLANEAVRDGLDNDPLVMGSLAIARDRALSDARLARLDLQNTPSEAALNAYARNIYKANASKYERPAQNRASHILLANSGPESLKKANDILSKLRAGASFAEMARTHSTDTGSAARGGDLGFFGAGKMVRPFEDAVNTLTKPGDLSEPVESQFGLHIIRLEERREKAIQPFEEVRSQLLSESRAAILNDARLQKVQSMNNEFVFEREAIEGLVKAPTR